METVPEPVNTKDLNYLLRRAVAEIIVEDELVQLLSSGKKLRLKFGLDPSAPDITLGHTVVFRKLRQFQELGHQVILIVGDWTAQIGDPSGVSATRKMLSAEQVKANADTYMKQFFMVVDKEKTEVKWQSEWFGKFDLADVVRLTSKFTVAQFLARDDFSKRFNEGRPIAITELLYPLLQAYDSVAIQADVEFGGTDQKFNLLVGRELQSMEGQKPQQVFMVPLLVGTDGVQKMSKSVGNYIGIAEPPENIYGKTMSIPDRLIMQYFELVTDVPDEELAEFKKQLSDNSVNPMTLKKRLASEIVTQLYSEKEAKEAEEYFEKVVQKKELPEEIQEHRLSFNALRFSTGEVDVRRLLTATRTAASASEASRLINQGAVEIGGKKVTRYQFQVSSGSVVKVGKHRFVKVINTD
jgi:tyrosyl-tRNA synthetase